LPEKFWR